MSISTGGTDMIGGTGYGGFGGGFGGIAPVGLIGLNNLFDSDKDRGGCRNGFDSPGTTVLEQNVSELRKDVAGVNTTVEALGNELQGALAQQTLGQTQEFRNLDNQICNAEKAAMTAAFEARIAALQSTNEIKSDINLLSVKTDAQTCEILRAINADGDATRALITTNQINDLRDQLAAERRGRDRDGIEISINNSNAQAQGQVQAQFQAQNNFLERKFNEFDNQINNTKQGIINLGTMVASGTQSSASTNIK